MSRAGDQALQEDHAGAEGPQRLLAGALVRVSQVVAGGDHADAPPTAARGRLEHQRVPDLLAGAQRIGEGGDLAATPRRDRDADLFGDQLCADLVAELAHRVRARSDERDPDLLAQLGERRVLGDESPAHPGGVGAGLHQRLLQHGVIEVRAGGRGAQEVSEVRLANEGRGPVGVGVERDGLDLHPGFCRKIPYRVDETHRGLSTVDDGNTTEHRLSLPSTPRTKGDVRIRTVACTFPYPARSLTDAPMATGRTPEPQRCRNPTKNAG